MDQPTDPSEPTVGSRRDASIPSSALVVAVAPRVIFLPDEYLGRYVASKTKTEIVLWKGHCEVHERFTGAEIGRFRRAAHLAGRLSAEDQPMTEKP